MRHNFVTKTGFFPKCATSVLKASNPFALKRNPHLQRTEGALHLHVASVGSHDGYSSGNVQTLSPHEGAVSIVAVTEARNEMMLSVVLKSASPFIESLIIGTLDSPMLAASLLFA